MFKIHQKFGVEILKRMSFEIQFGEENSVLLGLFGFRTT